MLFHSLTRKATALVVTTGMLIVVMGMLAMATERLRGIKQISDVDFAVQQAAAAAEAITSFRETRLVELAATNDLEALARNPETEALNDPYEGVQWFGGCLVRWRIEPVIVTDGNGRYITNPFLYGVKDTLLADPDFVENHEFYHFRILSEAHALENTNLIKDRTISELEADGDLPWQNPANRKCVVRASRIVQMSLNSLFKYALFYAKEGPYGDIEMGPGGWMGIAGRVHTNGAIYMASGKNTSWGGGGGMDIGNSTDKVDMVAINGVYRMRKDTLLDHRRGVGAHAGYEVPVTNPDWGEKVHYGDGNEDPLPWDDDFGIPLGSDLEDKSGTNYKLNGVNVARTADSRSGEEMREDHTAYLRDSKNSGATVVKTLSNIPQLGGRPFEHQRLFAEGTPIWTTNLSDPTDISSWTILPNETFLPATYYVDPEGDGGVVDLSFVTEPGTYSQQVVDFAKQLYYVEDPRGFKAYQDGNSYSGLPGDLSITVDFDADEDGFLDNSGLALTDVKDWYVDAGGLRQFYQRDASGNGIHVVNGSNTSEESVNVIDIFDTHDLYTYNPNPFGDNQPGDKPDYVGPGDAGFRYNGNYDNQDNSNGDRDGDSFGDNEVPGSYLDWAMNGKDDADNVNAAGDPLLGLVIRERRYQKVPETGTADDWAGKPDRPAISGGATLAGPTFQAEDGAISSASVDTNNAGYNGSGFVNVGGNGSTVTWTVDITTAGPTTVTFRYANGSGNRDVALDLNGSEIDGSYTMSSTGGWTTWNTINKTITFNAGINTLTLRTIGNDGGNVDEVTIPTANSAPASGFAAADYVNYLKSQYVVYFGTTDVTDEFFNYGASTATTEQDLVVWESEFLDRREGAFMQYQFWDQDTTTWPANSGNDFFEDQIYRVSLLTFNMRNTLDFLMNTDHGEVTTGTASGEMLNEYFSGMIYAHRTRRSNEYTPWETPLWHPTCHLHWKQTPIANYFRPPAGHLPWKDLPSTVWATNNGFDWRTGSGPAMTFQSSIRLQNAEDLNYGINFYTDMSTPDPSDDYYTKKGLTFITPNTCYIEGDFNTVQYGDSDYSGGLGTRVVKGHADWRSDDSLKHVPVAVFADFVNLLSNDWSDNQSYGSRPNVSSDCHMIVSVIMNNVPSHMDGDNYSHYSGGAHNILRYLESWSGDTHNIRGSLVVVNIRRYSFSHIGNNGGEPPNKGNSVYSPPNRDFEMNSDLFEKPGQPPFTPYGVTVTRTVSTVDILSK